MRVAQVNESAHLNSVKNFDTTPTDRPTARIPVPLIAGGCAGGLYGEVDWSTAPVKGHFDEVHNLLMHLHSYQIAGLVNQWNIVAFQYEWLTG